MAADSASPEHFAVMLPAMAGSRDPQRALKSAGLGWTPRAANRQPGGVAMVTRANATMTVKMIAGEGYMVKDSRLYGLDASVDLGVE